MKAPRAAAALALTVGCLAGCGPLATSGPGCVPLGGPVALDEALRESSGLAVSLTHADVLWTHNDAAQALWAVNPAGETLARLPLERRIRDLEDIGLGTCPGGGTCLYLADLGDNYEERTDVGLYRVEEPDLGGPPSASSPSAGGASADTLRLDYFPVRFPDGPRDVEALLVFAPDRILVVTKGRANPVSVYRYPGPLRADTVTLEEVQRLSDGPRIFPRQVTGGAVDPRTRLAALRTYESLTFYHLDGDTLAALPGATVNLRVLREPQGEAVALGPGGVVYLTSEGGPGGGPASLSKLRCTLGALARGP